MVKDIYFLGSTSNGFECYPSSKKYNTFYDNTGKGEVFRVRKRGHELECIYLHYGLLTALEGGRTGSVFGLVICLENTMFKDWLFVREKVCMAVFEKLLERGELVQKKNEKIGYVTRSLYDKKAYLDSWIANLKNSLTKLEIPLQGQDSKGRPQALGTDLSPEDYTKALRENGDFVIEEKYNKPTPQEKIAPLEENEKLQSKPTKQKTTSYPENSEPKETRRRRKKSHSGIPFAEVATGFVILAGLVFALYFFMLSNSASENRNSFIGIFKTESHVIQNNEQKSEKDTVKHKNETP